jgi:hypothetical protein
LITQSHAKVGNGLSDDEEPYLVVLGAWYWPSSECQTKEDALGRVRKYHEKCSDKVDEVFTKDDRTMFAPGDDPTKPGFNKWTLMPYGLDMAKVRGVNKNKFDPALKANNKNGKVYRGNRWMDNDTKTSGKEDIQKMMLNAQEAQDASPSSEPDMYDYNYESLNEVDDAMLIHENQDPEFDYDQIEFRQTQVNNTLSSSNNNRNYFINYKL